MRVVLQRTFPYADKEREDAELGQRKRRTRSVPRTKRQMRVVAPNIIMEEEEEDKRGWGKMTFGATKADAGAWK